MNQQQLSQVYEMVDSIPFSRQKKNIGRDFSDGLMMAQLIQNYYPKRVQVHNYPSTNTLSKKIQNWTTLNTKVLRKLGLSLQRKQIQQIASIKPMAIQKYLYRFLLKFQRPQQQNKITSRPYQDQSKQQDINGLFVNKRGSFINLRKEKEDTQEVLDMIDKIQFAYAQLIKLQEMTRLKDDLIKNLEKKVDKIIFN